MPVATLSSGKKKHFAYTRSGQNAYKSYVKAMGVGSRRKKRGKHWDNDGVEFDEDR
jgi:hypothetical protein|tara:strand:- start:1791 stop:1958 length:168 start_codon:yes stop_codon:yes gene_type:complete